MVTQTTNYSFGKPDVNNPNDQDIWGGELNANLDSQDTLFLTAITYPNGAAKTTGFTATVNKSSKNLYPCDATAGAFAATLPAASAAGIGSEVSFKKTDATANAITVTAAGADTIDTAATAMLSHQNDILRLISNGSNKWYVASTASANVFTGDSGTGGTTGLVPAPAAGSAAQRLMLGAGGVFANQTCIQMASVETGAYATGTTTIPLDDTIPQSTEGDQYMSLAFTPKLTTSTLRIWVQAFLGNGTGGTTLVGALFNGSSNAIAAGAIYNANNGFVFPLQFMHKYAPGAITPITFTFRAGGQNGGISTWFNGATGARLFGGVFASSLTIGEFIE